VSRTDNPFADLQNVTYVRADLTDFAPIKVRLEAFQPEVVFNCAACSDVDRCEEQRDQAHAINVELVTKLLTLSFRKLVHYSSDYVFNGENGPYTEDDKPDPINYYGSTKFESEKVLTDSSRQGLSDRDHLIIRTSLLYGALRRDRHNFVAWVIDGLARGEKLEVVDGQFATPTFAGNLARASAEAAFANQSGIMHVAGPDYFSRYEIALRVARVLGLSESLLRPVQPDRLRQKARRPSRAGLKSNRAKTILGTELMGLELGLSSMAEDASRFL